MSEIGITKRWICVVCNLNQIKQNKALTEGK